MPTATSVARSSWFPPTPSATAHPMPARPTPASTKAADPRASRAGLLARLARIAGSACHALAPTKGQLAVIVLFTILSLIGTVSAPALVHHPLLLVLLSPRLAFLALASTRLDLGVFLLAGLVRLSATDPVYFALGRRVGHRTFEDLAAQAGSRRWARRACWLRERSGAVLAFAVLLQPNARHVGLAGAQGMHGGWVAALSGAGTLAYLLAIRWGCDLLVQ
jgi:hypothetical protein